MLCKYECHQIGVPWIAENPSCPEHGNWGNQTQGDRREELRDILYRVWLRDLSADDGVDMVEALM